MSKLTEEKTEQVLNSLSRMKLLTNLMDFEYNMELPDVVKSPLVRNHIRRIKESIGEINMNLNRVVKLKRKDTEILDEFSAEIMDLIGIVSLMDIESRRAFNIDLKNYLKNKQ